MSIRYELCGNRPPLEIIEDSKNGIARQNGWRIEKHEIKYLNSNPDKKSPGVTFVRTIVSKKVVRMIQATKGQIWISGGVAKVHWKDKLLDEDNKVQFTYQ